MRFAKWAMVLGSLIWITVAEADQSRHFEFLYIDANEGSASGGHAAIKFDQQVFHFQHIEPGLLRLYRNDAAAFEFAYGFQENRNIYGHRIEVSEDFFQTLRDTFSRRLFIQNQQLSLLQALYDDQALVAGLQRLGSAPPLPIKGLGYFLKQYRATEAFTVEAGKPSNSSQALQQLHEAIVNEYGEDFLAAKRQQAWQTLQALKPELAVNPSANEPKDMRFTATNSSFAERYRNQLLNLAALDVLHARLSPLSESLLEIPEAACKLNSAQRAKLQDFRQRLFADLMTLMRSQRSDWGYPLLVGMARLHALDHAVASGYLSVLDRSRPESDDPQAAIIDEDNLPAALQYSQELFAAASKQLDSPIALDELAYSELELSATALMQLHKPRHEQQSLQLLPLTSTPSRPAAAELLGLPLPTSELADFQNSVTQQIETYQSQLQSLYGYNLLSRNCATEIFRLINQTVADISATAGESTIQASQRLLGGYVDEGGLNMIPFIAYDQIGSTYRLSTSFQRQPYRERQRQQRYRQMPQWQVDLQESNTLSSSIYQWNGDDAAFLFFTQDQLWPRPLQGGFNLAVAGGQGLYGLFSWPWDDGDNLHKGLKGIVVSLPELLFFNIRKGSFPGLLPETGIYRREAF
ncbi:hypothetical protein [Methylomonas fluvii]|uniref:DUF4105 domain-containing protein n=1 Tax=Methylomonas fluvii TaxID=1854564 RepID=A0ABR9DC55_9GAMM|nr:hypothetical protein [Methylomonas fluvii]MBD9360643.1 hypothetical protein [Methylomonas fluvii]